MRSKKKLAILGGDPIVKIPAPHHVWPKITDAEIKAVTEQMESGELSYYRRSGIIEKFEDTFADFHNRKYAVSTHSGTAALHAAYFSLGLPPGTEVIAPAYTHLGTVMPMLHVGLQPVLCDIQPETGNIDPVAIISKITSLTGAIVVTHQFGHICEMNNILAIAQKHKLFVIEDCSHAHGSTLNKQMAGSFGDIACFSLQSHKTVWGGEGGILITNNASLADKASLLGHFRQQHPYTPEEHILLCESGYGLKNRLHPLAAALANLQLKKLPDTIAKREKNYEYFNKAIGKIAGLSSLKSDSTITRGGFFRFIVKYNSSYYRDLPTEIYAKILQTEGVLTVSPGSAAKPLHMYHIFQCGTTQQFPGISLTYKPGDFPKAEAFSQNTLQFPAFTDPAFTIIDEYEKAMLKVQQHFDENIKDTADIKNLLCQ